MERRTIMILPEFENIETINQIRKKYDPLEGLVKPHITVVFPFNSEMSNEELSQYLSQGLRGIKPFKIELKGFDKQENKYGNYLFLNVIQGMDMIKSIHNKLYADKLKCFDAGYQYVPHMTVGKLPSSQLLDEAYLEVSKCQEKFESIIIFEHKLN